MIEDPLSCEVRSEHDGVRVRLAGTLDLATEQLLEDTLADLRAAGHRKLMVDLRGLVFMDSTGLRLVQRWNTAARTDGFVLRFVRGVPRVQRVFEITGTAAHIAFVDLG